MMSGRESCIWCGEDWPKFYKHKLYCVQCASACKKECRTCHKPYPELRFFKDGADRCNTCETRREREQMKKTGGLKLQVADSLLPFRSMSPSSDGESVDGFEPKLSSSEKKTNNNNKRKTRRRIESETEEEAAAEVGEEEDDDGGSNAGDYMDVESDCNKRVGSEKSGETRDDDDDDDGEVTRHNKKVKRSRMLQKLCWITSMWVTRKEKRKRFRLNWPSRKRSARVTKN